ncbi:MAG TPA: alpha/beta hydrolase [Acidimicrobiales bacterium]|nr:alpha/beta hydrolase [Acidimicrobiales bacterium]
MATEMKIAHTVVGSGDPVLLVSGLGQRGERWSRVARMLADDFTVVTVDNRETGDTGPCPDGFLLSDLATDAVGVMTALGHDRFFLAGISMGGMISQEIIRLFPERIRAAGLFSTHGGAADSIPPADPGVLLGSGPPPTTEAEVLERATASWNRLYGPGFGAAHPEILAAEARIGATKPTRAEGYIRQFQAIVQWNPGDALVGTDVPLVIAHGDTDPLVPYENGVRLAARLGLELITYEGAGHLLESERAEEVTELLRTHFQKAAANGR